MLNFRTAALLQPDPLTSPEDSRRARNENSGTRRPANQRIGQLVKFRSPAAPPVRRGLSPKAGRALEILGHAIEYLADEYATDRDHKGPLGNADPRVQAIQMLKALNRTIYYSGTELEPPFRRIRRWFIGIRRGYTP